MSAIIWAIGFFALLIFHIYWMRTLTNDLEEIGGKYTKIILKQSDYIAQLHSLNTQQGDLVVLMRRLAIQAPASAHLDRFQDLLDRHRILSIQHLGSGDFNDFIRATKANSTVNSSETLQSVHPRGVS